MKDQFLIELEDRLKGKKIEYFKEKTAKDHKQVLGTFKKDWTLYSVIVYQNYEILSKLYNDNSLFKKTKENWVSELEEEYNSFLFKNNNSITQEIEQKLSKRKILRQKNKNFYQEFDKELDKLKAVKIKELLNDLLLQHTYFYLLDKKGLDKKPEETHDLEAKKYLDKNPEFKEKLIKKLTKPRVNYKKERIYQHQTNSELAGLLELEPWMQIYFMEKDGVVFTERGKYTGSGGRYSHGFFGHLFAELQNKGHKIDTYILKIDEKCQLQALKEEELILHSSSLVRSNYSYDYKKSQVIFDKIKTIEDPMGLSWDYFLKTGNTWTPYRKNNDKAKK